MSPGTLEKALLAPPFRNSTLDVPLHHLTLPHAAHFTEEDPTAVSVLQLADIRTVPRGVCSGSSDRRRGSDN